MLQKYLNEGHLILCRHVKMICSEAAEPFFDSGGKIKIIMEAAEAKYIWQIFEEIHLLSNNYIIATPHILQPLPGQDFFSKNVWLAMWELITNFEDFFNEYIAHSSLI